MIISIIHYFYVKIKSELEILRQFYEKMKQAFSY